MSGASSFQVAPLLFFGSGKLPGGLQIPAHLRYLGSRPCLPAPVMIIEIGRGLPSLDLPEEWRTDPWQRAWGPVMEMSQVGSSFKGHPAKAKRLGAGSVGPSSPTPILVQKERRATHMWRCQAASL